MPKRAPVANVKVPSNKKGKATKKADVSLPVPTLPTPQPPQMAVAERGNTLLMDTCSVMLVGEEGVTSSGKTIIMGQVLRGEALAWKEEGKKVLAIYDGTSTQMAEDNAAAMGAVEAHSPFSFEAARGNQLSKMETAKAMVEEHGFVTLSATHSFVRDILICGKYGKKISEPPKLDVLVEELGVDVVILVIDEAHKAYNSKKFPDAIHDWRVKFDGTGDLPKVTIVVLPMTATPNLNKKSTCDNLMKLCATGDELPPMLGYEGDEYAKYMEAGQITPIAPTEAKIVLDTGAPLVTDDTVMIQVKKVQSSIIELFKEEDTNQMVTMRGRVFDSANLVAASLAIGLDGGKLMEVVTKGDMRVQIAANGKPAGDPMPLKYESVIIGTIGTKAAEDTLLASLMALETKNAGSDTPIKVFDLRYTYNTSKTKRRAQRAQFKAAVRAQNATVIGIIGSKSQQGNNELTNLATTWVFIGEAKPGQLVQFYGRSSRTFCVLEDGEFVPTEDIGYKTVHFTSKWTHSIMQIELAKTKRKDPPPLTDDMQAKLSELKGKTGLYRHGVIELNTGKAIIADKIFNTNGQFALDYLEAEIALTKPPEKPVAQSEAKDDDEEGEGEEVAEVEGDADGGD